MSTWAGYVRVSHVGGRGGDSFHSPDDQAAIINAWARQRGVTVDVLPPELDGKSDDASRPILNRALRGIENGEYTGLVVAYLSRASRSLRLTLDLWDRVEAAGGSIHAIRENLDTSTSNGRLQRNLLASIDAHHLDAKREEFEAVRRSTVRRGVWRQRQTPLGYRLAGPRPAGLVPDDNAATVRAAFVDRAAGASISDLARRLGMTPSGMRMLLRNRVYLGELRDGQNVKPDAHEPLIDVATFEAAQRTGPRPPRVHREPALLAGLVRCASCGHLMTRGGNRNVPAYTCPASHSGERCPQPAAATVALLDAYVERIALAELSRLSVTASEGKTTERAQAAVEAAESELAAFLKVARATDAGYGEAVQDRRDAVDAARQAWRAELAKNSVIPDFKTGADAWESLNGHDRNALLRGLLAAVVVAPAGRGSRMPFDERVRVLRFGAAVKLPQRRGGEASGIVPITLPDVDSPDVLRPVAGEDALKHRGGVVKVSAHASPHGSRARTPSV